MDGYGGANIQNALLDSLPVKNVFWPTVLRSRYYAKHVLHAESDAGPVMRLNLWHGNDKIGCEDRAGQPQGLHSGVAREQAPFDEFVTIQIDKRDSLFVELVRKPALDENEFSVPLVPRPLADEYSCGPQATKALDRSGNKKWMRVDVVSRDVINEVRFEENGLSSNIQMEQIQAVPQDLFQILRVRFRGKNRHSGPWPSSIDVVFGHSHQRCCGCPSS